MDPKILGQKKVVQKYFRSKNIVGVGPKKKIWSKKVLVKKLLVKFFYKLGPKNFYAKIFGLKNLRVEKIW